MSSLDHKKSAWIAITLVIFCGLAVRAFLFNGGIRGSDAFAYAQYAHDIATSVNGLFKLSHFRS